MCNIVGAIYGWFEKSMCKKLHYSVTRWLYSYLIYGHLQQLQFAQSHKNAKVEKSY